MLVVTLVALTLTIAPTREALLGVVLGPTPTATMPVPAGEDNLYVSLVPQWGAVTLDGKTLSHLPVEGIDQPFHLARGVHVIRWRFPPIIDFSCRLTVPTALGDTCPLRVGILPGKKGIASVVSLQCRLPTSCQPTAQRWPQQSRRPWMLGSQVRLCARAKAISAHRTWSGSLSWRLSRYGRR